MDPRSRFYDRWWFFLDWTLTFLFWVSIGAIAGVVVNLVIWWWPR